MTARKICFVLLFAFLLVAKMGAQEMKALFYKDDTSAIFLLKKMSATMQSLESCSFTAHLFYDILNEDFGCIKHSAEEKIYMKFPNKFLISSEGDKGNLVLVCDGDNFYYYSLTTNQYAQTKAEPHIVETIDKIHTEFGFDFPAADFFYPSFVDDILETGGVLVNLGLVKVSGKWCFHIVGKDADNTGFQFWIAEDPMCLPVKMVINYPDQNIQYEATYTDWSISNVFPDALFQFSVPPRAKQINLMKPSSKN